MENYVIVHRENYTLFLQECKDWVSKGFIPAGGMVRTVSEYTQTFYLPETVKPSVVGTVEPPKDYVVSANEEVPVIKRGRKPKVFGL